MTKKEAQQFRRLLLKKRESIMREIQDITRENMKSIKEASGNLSSYSYHMADMASDNYDREISFSIADGENKVLYEIDEALKRIEEGTYGKCIACDRRIPLKRLKALPYAKYCIQCQSQEEKNNR
jgi:RNA polymerase-binding protein DksA